MASEGGGQSPTRRGGRRSVNYNNNSMNVDEELHGTGAEAGGETVLWDRFERVASAVTKLYRNPSWQIFQQAAASTTEFYKDSVEAHRRGFDSGVVLGRQLLCKELLAWLQSSAHPYVRRDECINVILGRTTQTNSNSSSVQQIVPSTVVNNVHSSSVVDNQRFHNNNSTNDPTSVIGDELEIFHDALNSPPDLTAFFLEECRRHTKRRFHDDDDNSNGGDGCFKKRIRRA